MHQRGLVWGGVALMGCLWSGAAHAQVWEPVPLVTRETRAAGVEGGEGCQWPQAVAADGKTGTFLLFGSDVGGIFRSLDGGVHWEPCNVGYSARGNCGFAIDPHNPKRAIAVGANSIGGQYNGLYLTTNQAASWKQTLSAKICGYRDMRAQVTFDPTTYDAKKGYTRVVYWSRGTDDPKVYDVEIHPALYKSEDGGTTWREIPNTAEAAGASFLRHHPTRQGVLYAGSATGVRKSSDGGLTWTKIWDASVTGLDVSPKSPRSVWASKNDGVWRSDDEGATWKQAANEGLLHEKDLPRNVHVSPANPNHLVLWRIPEPFSWDWRRFASRDGGKTWQQAKQDSTHAFVPNNVREGIFAWHPTNPNVAWSSGGDWPTKSTDAGRTWKWSGSGYNVILPGRFNFSTQNPNVLFLSSQDYNGAVTRDGGRTWEYSNVSGNSWGGFTYGGYAASGDTLVVGDAAGWGERRRLKVSQDGGKTWQDKKIDLGWRDIGYSDPQDPKVIFCYDHRSADGGETWAKMPDCDGVYTSSPVGNRALYGIKEVEENGKQSRVVRSTDKGATWQIVAQLPGGVSDLAYDHRLDRVYVANEKRVRFCDLKNKEVWTTAETPKDQGGNYWIESVAVDPKDTTVVYAGSGTGIYASSVGFLRSLDSGATWTNLTVNTPLRPGIKDGGRNVFHVRVHPVTRYAWVAEGCDGIWKIAPPQKAKPAKASSARQAARAKRSAR